MNSQRRQIGTARRGLSRFFSEQAVWRGYAHRDRRHRLSVRSSVLSVKLSAPSSPVYSNEGDKGRTFVPFEQT